MFKHVLLAVPALVMTGCVCNNSERSTPEKMLVFVYHPNDQSSASLNFVCDGVPIRSNKSITYTDEYGHDNVFQGEWSAIDAETKQTISFKGLWICSPAKEMQEQP